MSMAEPFMPHPEHEETIAAADPGPGGPEPAPGFGMEAEDPDTAAEVGGAGDDSGSAAAPDAQFRTPDPEDVRRAP